MPPDDPTPSGRLAALHRFRRLITGIGLLSVLAAATAVGLAAAGSESPYVQILIAASLGTALFVFMATAVISLLFLRARSGHGGQASRTEDQE